MTNLDYYRNQRRIAYEAIQSFHRQFSRDEVNSSQTLRDTHIKLLLHYEKMSAKYDAELLTTN